jgi:GntR family transcriptional regulator, transcriptional repressor for pyruvate dehydrogenase complex
MEAMLPDLGPAARPAPEPISSEVTRRLLDYLISGQVHPGERLPSERQLAETLGVGRSHVRQAIKSLSVLGLIDARQGDGTYLKRTDSPLLPLAIEWGLLLGTKRSQDLVEARSELEILLAGLAAEQRDDAALAEMRRNADIMRSTTDNDAFVAADVAFHLEIARATGIESLFQIMRSIRSLLEVWIHRVAYAPGTRPATWAEHAAVFEAIEARDAAAARRAMTEHMNAAAVRLQVTFTEQEQAASAADGGPDIAGTVRQP